MKFKRLSLWGFILLVILTISHSAFALSVGDVAPSFSGASTSGKNISLSDYKGKWVVLYFYPKAFTPGCTAESLSLASGYDSIVGKNAVVLGVSLDNVERQKEFKSAKNLPFELISDEQKSLMNSYDVKGLLGLYAKRRTFIIDPKGVIQHIVVDVKTKTHSADVLMLLDELQKR